jgi:NDP-sugar pyrophosphorylase family protein
VEDWRSEESAFSESRAGRSASLHTLAFSGIHMISPRALPMLTEEGIFSIIPSYLRLASQGQPILAFRADAYYWRDLGRPADLTQAALDLQQKALWGSERNLS